MQGRLSPFQIGLLLAFVIFIIAGVGFLALSGSFQSGSKANLVMWGTAPESALVPVIERISQATDLPYTLSYVSKDKDRFAQDFLEALATGQGPDLIFLPQDSILRDRNKLFTVPFDTYSARDFQDTFIEEGELYLEPGGILAFPVAVDPLVMYWNRDILSSVGVATPPKRWEEIVSLARRVNEVDSNFNVKRSVAALGEFSNIEHAKEILATLIMQAGGKLAVRDGNTVRAALTDVAAEQFPPTQSGLGFFTEFSNPVKQVYSWNKSMPEAQDAFISGTTAVYFGFGSELRQLRERNPNLNFDIALIPQTSTTGGRLTFGNMMGIAIVAQTPDPAAALSAVYDLTIGELTEQLVAGLDLTPARRDLLSTAPTNAYGPVLYESALVTRGWLDPDPAVSEVILSVMTAEVTSGRALLSEAIDRAQSKLAALFQQ